jgi:hypothetical protein
MNLSFNDQHIPQALKATPSWICWMAKPNGERVEKIPVCATTLQHASSTDPGTWTTYEKAKHVAEKHAGLGLGFVFQRNAGIVGIDLDKCRDASTGVMEPWAHDIVRDLNSYTEASPSGTGVHTYVCGALPPGRRKRGRVEAYEDGRFFTVTGYALADTPATVEARPEQLAAFHAAHLADPVPERPAQPVTRTTALGDVAIIDLCRKARNAGKFEALWRGKAAGYASQSDADLALIGLLKFYTQDAGQLDRLFRQSGLMREKWDRADYRDRTIAEALNHVSQTYNGHEVRTGRVSHVAVSDPEEWPEPEPLAAQGEAEPYPLDALPDLLLAAVAEVQGFTKAPIPMVASSALAAVSVAVQAHVDIRRTDKLEGPTGVFLLTIADSGERKSTCDGFFVQAIQEYEAEQIEVAKPQQKLYAAAFASWKAEQEGVLSAIKQAAKTGKSVEKLRGELLTLEGNKPKPPKVPKLLRGDDTPENLAWVLASEWPSIGVITAEAGCVLGSHGMGTDSVMRNLALLNTLWDGKDHRVGRRTSESFTVRGARLTMGLQVQETTLRSFFDRSKGLARGTGFLARFLVSWPESTQGTRLFTEPPDAWPLLAAFHRRMAELLNTPVPMDDAGALSPAMLSLSPEAKAVWVEFHDALEGQLRAGGELHDVRDVASKTADNAVRMAALFQFFCSKCSSSSGLVTVEHMESASRIAAWHLSESRRFFGELALPPELANPMRLDAWLLSHCQREQVQKVSARTVQQFGPNQLREKVVIEAAVRELETLGRARLVKDGRHKIIQVNPALLSRGEP